MPTSTLIQIHVWSRMFNAQQLIHLTQVNYRIFIRFSYSGLFGSWGGLAPFSIQVMLHCVADTLEWAVLPIIKMEMSTAIGLTSLRETSVSPDAYTCGPDTYFHMTIFI